MAPKKPSTKSSTFVKYYLNYLVDILSNEYVLGVLLAIILINYFEQPAILYSPIRSIKVTITDFYNRMVRMGICIKEAAVAPTPSK